MRALGIECLAASPPSGTEPLPEKGEDPAVFAARAAKAKADGVYDVLAQNRSDDCAVPAVLGADTVVFCGGAIYGKPSDAAEALCFLEELSGKEHCVLTACYLRLNREEGEVFSGRARVEMAAWPRSVLKAYAETGEGLDKAGGYAVQGKGAFLVSGLSGSWSAVVGLPVAESVAALMRRQIIEVVRSDDAL